MYFDYHIYHLFVERVFIKNHLFLSHINYSWYNVNKF